MDKQKIGFTYYIWSDYFIRDIVKKQLNITGSNYLEKHEEVIFVQVRKTIPSNSVFLLNKGEMSCNFSYGVHDHQRSLSESAQSNVSSL